MENKIINFDVYIEERRKAGQVADAAERELRYLLLENIREAEQKWDMYQKKWDFRDHLQRLKEKGLVCTPVNNQNIIAEWMTLFAASVSQEECDRIHIDQFKWHLFSYKLLEALSDEDARQAFDALPKDSAYFFDEYGMKTYLIENIHLLKAEDFDHRFVPCDDFYLFDPKGKWTYIHTHEIMCGPYFYKLP